MKIAGTEFSLQDIQDAQVLEDFEQLQMRNRRITHCIEDTYTTEFKSKGMTFTDKDGYSGIRISNRPFTKKRRKLVGRNGKPRKWKNKEKQYAVLKTGMMVSEFNARGPANEAQQRLLKKMAEKQKKTSLLPND